MPFLSIAKYEAVAAGEDGRELARASFLYLPLSNLAFVLAAALGVAALGVRFSGLIRVHSAWWLLAPVILGSGLFDFFCSHSYSG